MSGRVRSKRVSGRSSGRDLYRRGCCSVCHSQGTHPVGDANCGRGGWKEGGSGGWNGLWLDDDHNVVQIGSNTNNNTSSSCSEPSDTVIWLMTKLIHFLDQSSTSTTLHQLPRAVHVSARCYDGEHI